MTHTFLLSGVETEITHLGGEQQGILSKETKNQTDEDVARKLLEMVETLVIRVGNVVIADLNPKERKEFFKKMPAPHIYQILTEARTFTYGDEDFVFTFDYEMPVIVDGERTNRKEKKSKEMVLEIPNGFPVVPIKKFEPGMLNEVTTLKQLRNIAGGLEPLNITDNDYSKVVENCTIEYTAPISKQRMRLTLRNGMSSYIIGAIDANTRDSNAMLMTFDPKYQTEEGGNWFNYRVEQARKAHSLDLEFMRLIAKIFEGRVDTELEFEHPEISGKKEYTNLLMQMAFFFPSEGV